MRPATCIALLAPALLCAGNFQGSVTVSHATAAVRGARIRVKQVGAARLTADLETGGDGKFESAVDLPPGEYSIDISKPNHASVTLCARLPLPGPLAVRLTRLGSITGRVTDPTGRPMGGAQVMPMVAFEGRRFRPSREGFSFTVDSTGNYRIHGLAPGSYAVALTWASISGAEAPSRPTGAYLYPDNANPRVFEVTSGTAVSGIDFIMPRQSGATISGRVTGLEDGYISGIALVLRDQPTLAVAMQRTQGDGSFRFDRVAPGAYELRAAGPSNGYAGWGATLDKKPKFGQRRIDAAGQNLAGIDVALEPSRSVKLSLDAPADCRSTANATVRLEPLENWGSLLSRDVEVTADRETTVSDLAPERYWASIVKSAEGCYSTGRVVVDARSGAPAKVGIARGGSIQGRVEGTAAVATLTSVEDPTQPEQAMALDKGEFRFNGLRPGRYRIRAGDTSMDVLVQANRRTEANIRIEEKQP